MLTKGLWGRTEPRGEQHRPQADAQAETQWGCPVHYSSAGAGDGRVPKARAGASGEAEPGVRRVSPAEGPHDGGRDWRRIRRGYHLPSVAQSHSAACTRCPE